VFVVVAFLPIPYGRHREEKEVFRPYLSNEFVEGACVSCVCSLYLLLSSDYYVVLCLTWVKGKFCLIDGVCYVYYVVGFGWVWDSVRVRDGVMKSLSYVMEVLLYGV
jgi:hypothetical protein